MEWVVNFHIVYKRKNSLTLFKKERFDNYLFFYFWEKKEKTQTCLETIGFFVQTRYFFLFGNWVPNKTSKDPKHFLRKFQKKKIYIPNRFMIL